MRKYRLEKELTTSEILKEINKYPEVTEWCCNCGHVNGECTDFAKEGTCRAYNFYKDYLKDKCTI